MNRPVPVARFGVGLAVRTLPTWQDRLRYRAEFLAELDGMSTGEQLRYTAGILSQLFALRAALGARGSLIEEKAMQTIPLRRRFLCRALHWHDWHSYSTEDGGRYSACTVCHKEHLGKMGPDWGAVG